MTKIEINNLLGFITVIAPKNKSTLSSSDFENYVKMNTSFVTTEEFRKEDGFEVLNEPEESEFETYTVDTHQRFYFLPNNFNLIIPENIKKIESNILRNVRKSESKKLSFKNLVIQNKNIVLEKDAFANIQIENLLFKGTQNDFERIKSEIPVKTIIFDENLINEINGSNFEEIYNFEITKQQKILEIKKTSITTPLEVFLKNNGFEVLVREAFEKKLDKLQKSNLIFDFVAKKDNINYLFEIDGKKCENLALALNDKTTNTIEEINEILLPFMSGEWWWMTTKVILEGNIVFLSGVKKLNHYFHSSKFSTVFLPSSISKINFGLFRDISNGEELYPHINFSFENDDIKKVFEKNKELNKDNLSTADSLEYESFLEEYGYIIDSYLCGNFF